MVNNTNNSITKRKIGKKLNPFIHGNPQGNPHGNPHGKPQGKPSNPEKRDENTKMMRRTPTMIPNADEPPLAPKHSSLPVLLLYLPDGGVFKGAPHFVQ